MSVKQLLDKIRTHNPSVRGCVLSYGDKVHSNLTGNYEIIDTSELTELGDRLLKLSEAAPELEPGSETAFLEYENHSVFVRRVDAGCLVLLADPMPLAGFKKINVGINLFLKPIKAALTETTPEEPAPVEKKPTPPPAAPMILRASDPIAGKRVVELSDDIPPAPEVGAKPDTPPKRRRFYRGISY
ncbi:MAG: hypothetical protein AAF813_08090 [Pseudomonadota bacterium]